jgi:simple sugar transport system permease protein
MTDSSIQTYAQGAKPALAVILRPLLLSVAPVLAALLISALVLTLAGGEPLSYYGYIVNRGLFRPSGIQATLVYMIPMLIVAAALIVSFRAGLWNLGIDGQVLAGTLAAAIVGPWLAAHMHFLPALILSMAFAALVGGLWAVPMAALKAYQGVNEVISGVMMGFLARSACAAIVKLWAHDPNSLSPQTYSLPIADRLPLLLGTNVNMGILLAIVIILGCHVMMTRTAYGLKLNLLGLSPRAGRHVGINVKRLSLLTMCFSGALGGLAGAIDVVGVLGNMQATWSPSYGDAVVPLVFLARLNGYASIIYIFFFSVLHVGSASAATRLGIPQDFTLVLVGLLLVFLALAEFLDQRFKVGRKG